MLKSGAKLFGALIVCVTIVFLLWTQVPWSAITDAQAILVTGFLAAIIAVWAVFSQRAIARRQCTLEHIARLQADGDLIRGRVIFRELAKKPEGLAVWAGADKEQTDEYQAITTRLNEFELISIGIQRGTIDFELYSRWYKSGTVRAWQDAEGFIKATRTRFNNQMIFHEFQEMVRWFENDNRPPHRKWWLGNLF